jgi:NSS family neurotransmitter:Na+ symporter
MNQKHLKQSWHNRWGFVLAAMSSAIGLANIWRFPYLVGEHGGGAFIALYLICLLFAGLPIFVLETLIGREASTSSADAMHTIVPRFFWKAAGLLSVFTAFLVSAYYAVVAGWVMGYWAQALTGELSSLHTGIAAKAHFNQSIASFSFSWVWPLVFLLLSCSIVAYGVQSGLEKASRWLMPLLFSLFAALVTWCFIYLDAARILHLVFKPNWSQVNSSSFLAALGQAFFTLSIGQGTIITYGSYLKKQDPLISLAIPVILADTLVSILATVVVFSICVQSGASINSGPGLVFETLPVLFNQFHLSSLLGFTFFSLLVIATLTSEMSAIEPVVAWLSPRLGRKKALIVSAVAMIFVMLPAALSYRGVELGWWHSPSCLWQYDALCTRFLIPLGGALAIIFAYCGWGLSSVISALDRTDFPNTKVGNFIKIYFLFCYKLATPILIGLVFLYSVIYGS